MSRDAVTSRPYIAILSVLFDAAFILIFAAIGRGSHAREASVLGLLETAWPFLAALALVWAGIWLVTRPIRRPFAPIRIGIPIWLGTVIIGLLLRGVTGGGLALPFVLVATGTLCLLLIGWRAIATVIVAAVTRAASRRES